MTTGNSYTDPPPPCIALDAMLKRYIRIRMKTPALVTDIRIKRAIRDERRTDE